MPTYQYSCTECGHFFEKVQSFSEEALTVCPACEGRLRKVFNAVGVVFKGSGFYRTDSRSTDSRSTDSPTTGATAGSSSTPAAASGSSGAKEGSSTSGTAAKSGGSSAENAA